RYIDARQVLTKILMPRGHTRHTRDGGSPGSDIPTGLDRLLADALSQQHIGVEEILEELREKRVPVCGNRLLDASETGPVKALRIVRRLQQEWRDASNDHGLADPLRSVLAEVTCHFAATHRKADKRHVSEAQVGDQLSQVFGENVVLIAGGWLAGLAESPAVIGDDAIAGMQ